MGFASFQGQVREQVLTRGIKNDAGEEMKWTLYRNKDSELIEELS